MKNNNDITNKPLENIPFLSKIEKKNNFSVPKDYFKENIEVDLYKNMDYSILHFSIDKLSYRLLLPFLGLASLIIVTFFFNQPTPTSTISNEEISEILINDNYIDIDEELLIEAYSEMLKNETILEENVENENTEYINYLIENDIDITTIINEL